MKSVVRRRHQSRLGPHQVEIIQLVHMFRVAFTICGPDKVSDTQSLLRFLLAQKALHSEAAGDRTMVSHKTNGVRQVGMDTPVGYQEVVRWPEFSSGSRRSQHR